MVTQVVEVRCGLKFPFSVPANEIEYVAAADRGPGAMLEDALATNIYRAGLPDVWKKLAAEVGALPGAVSRKTKAHPNAAKAAKGETVVDETAPAYVERAAVAFDTANGQKDGTAMAEFQKLVDAWGITTLDLTERRGEGTQLVGKQDLEMALNFIKAGPEKLQKALSKIHHVIGGDPIVVTGVETDDQHTIALAIKAWRAAIANAGKLIS